MRDYGTTNNTPAHQAPPVWRAPEGLEDLTAAQVGDGGACQHTNDKPDRSGAPRGLRGLAAVPVGDGGAAPVTWRCTRYVAVHPNRRGVMPTDRVHCPHQQAQPRIRTPPHGQALHHWACTHVVEGLFMRLWSRPLIVAGIGVVPQEPEEGLAAVLVGDGRAWPGFEIDHSERSSRVAISRAGRRPRDGKKAGEKSPLTRADLGLRLAPGAVAGPGRASSCDTRPLGPVGGGRAWPGFEIDHSERSSRVAISRAGRRPPAPTRRHKHSATNT